jgi:hypothetical protein
LRDGWRQSSSRPERQFIFQSRRPSRKHPAGGGGRKTNGNDRSRRKARQSVSSGGVEFVEIHVSAPIEVCESRDPKALYQKARAGLIQGFTGIDAPYESPEDPELILKTGQESIETSLNQLLAFVIPLLRLDEAEYEI